MAKRMYDYRQGFVAYPDGRAGPTGEKAPYVDHGTVPPDPARYYSKEEMDLEWQHVWTKVWAFAGLAQDIPNVGDYLRYNLGKESFIVVRDAPGDAGVKAYYNACPHRGNRLVHNDFGHTAGGCFTCDFHGWKYRLDGTNQLIRDELIFRPEVVRDRPGLTPVSCSIWNSLIPGPRRACSSSSM
jgi:phenylpropionate dioxygenase-like ring-hydroxylating dioxygenase large terminal subunit